MVMASTAVCNYDVTNNIINIIIVIVRYNGAAVLNSQKSGL